MFLGTHTRDAHDLVQASLEHLGSGQTGPKAQKVQRPSIPEDCSEVQWEDYKGFYRLASKGEIYSHMRSCCSDSLQYKLYEANGLDGQEYDREGAAWGDQAASHSEGEHSSSCKGVFGAATRPR